MSRGMKRFDLLLRQPHCVCGEVQLTSSYQEIVAEWFMRRNADNNIESHIEEEMESSKPELPCAEWRCCPNATLQYTSNDTSSGSDDDPLDESSVVPHSAHHYSAAQPCNRCGVSAARHFRQPASRTTSMTQAVNDKFVSMHVRCAEKSQSLKVKTEQMTPPLSAAHSPTSNAKCYDVDHDNQLPADEVDVAIRRLYMTQRNLGISRLSSREDDMKDVLRMS